MLYILIAILLGAFLNRVRGGLFEWLPCNKLIQPIVYGLLLGLYVDVEGVSSLWFGVVNGLSMYIGQQITGWGSYIGSLTGKAPPTPECPMIDEILNDIHFSIKGSDYYLDEFPRAWGFLGLMMRGFIWSFLLGVCLYSLPIMLSGLMMPVCYLIPTIIQIIFKIEKPKFAWNIGEWIYGGYMWGVIAYCLGG